MRILVLVLLSYLLLGCGTQKQFIIDPTFQSIVNTWDSHMDFKARVSITFKPLPYPEAGLCNGDVFIDPTWWREQKIDSAKEELVLHELGHCVLFLEHDTSMSIIDGELIYTSIMYPVVFGDQPFYLRHRDYYLNQLKQKLAEEGMVHE